MLDLQTVPVPREEFCVRKVGDETVFLTESGNEVLSLNAVGTFVWEQVDGNIPNAPENCVVAEIETSSFDPEVAYVALDCHARDDHAPYLYRTDNLGRTWTSVAGNLSDGPSYVVREDPDNPRVLYAGVEHGVQVSIDGGEHWVPLGSGLPTAGVRAMAIQPRDRDLAVGTFGRAIWTA